MSVADFQQRLSKFLAYLQTSHEVNGVFDDLFNFGIFGIAVTKKPSTEAQQTGFRFGFVGDRFSRKVYTAVDENHILALSPMFREYCGCDPSEYGVVVPVEG